MKVKVTLYLSFFRYRMTKNTFFFIMALGECIKVEVPFSEIT
jgi:hypothetical protein